MYVQPYVFFNGRCEEALKFYGEKLGAEVLLLMRFKEAPSDPKNQPSPEVADKIMHASVRIGTTIWMASDGNCDPATHPLNGFSLSLTADDAASGEQYFNALAEGGKVTMPWQATFWSKGFGMVVDQFGLGWMVTLPQES